MRSASNHTRAGLLVAAVLAVSCTPLVGSRHPDRPPSAPVRLEPPPESPGAPGFHAGLFGWPVASVAKRIVDSPFGVRTIESLSTREIHDGVDIRTSAGATVVAARDGRVAWVGERPAFGWTVILEHADRWQTVYGNLSRPAVIAGDSVVKGDEIGRTSSRCDGDDGACLHFEIRWQGRAVDPAPLLGGR